MNDMHSSWEVELVKIWSGSRLFLLMSKYLGIVTHQIRWLTVELLLIGKVG